MSNKPQEREKENEEKNCCQELREEFRLHRFKLEHPYPIHFVSSQCFKSSIYTIWSGVWAVYHLAMLMLEIYYNKDVGGEYLIFLTNWSYSVVGCASIADFVITLYVYVQRKDIVEQCDSSLPAPWYMKIQWIFFNIANTASVLVTLLYYILLDVAWTHSSTNKHLINSVYTIFNLLFCAKPIRILHVYQPFAYALIYVLFTIIYYVSGGGVVYSVLDWSKTGSAVLISFLVLFLGVPVVHTFCFALYTLRQFVYSKCCNFSYLKKRKEIQREVTPRDVEIYEVSKSRPGTNRPETNRTGTNRPQTRISVLPV